MNTHQEYSFSLAALLSPVPRTYGNLLDVHKFVFKYNQTKQECLVDITIHWHCILHMVVHMYFIKMKCAPVTCVICTEMTGEIWKLNEKVFILIFNIIIYCANLTTEAMDFWC